MARRRRRQREDPIAALVSSIVVGSFFGVFYLTNSLVPAAISAAGVRAA